MMNNRIKANFFKIIYLNFNFKKKKKKKKKNKNIR